MLKPAPIIFTLLGLLMASGIAYAGGVAPEEEFSQEPVVRETVTATPAQTSAAVSEARRAVASPARSQPAPAPTPTVQEVSIPPARAKAVSAKDKNSWLLSSREGGCAPLSSINRKVKNIGSFNTPQEFGRKMQQRGHQAFVLDIGDVRDQVVRVKVPDQELDLTFVRAAMCR